MRGFAFILLALSCPAWCVAQSIEPKPGVAEVGGDVELKAWSEDNTPLVGLEIGLRGLDDDGAPVGDVLVRCTTDQEGVGRLGIEHPVGRYRFEAEVGGIEVHAPFRVVQPAPRLLWASLGAVAVLAALVVSRRGSRRRAGENAEDQAAAS